MHFSPEVILPSQGMYSDPVSRHICIFLPKVIRMICKGTLSQRIARTLKIRKASLIIPSNVSEGQSLHCVTCLVDWTCGVTLWVSVATNVICCLTCFFFSVSLCYFVCVYPVFSFDNLFTLLFPFKKIILKGNDI